MSYPRLSKSLETVELSEEDFEKIFSLYGKEFRESKQKDTWGYGKKDSSTPPLMKKLQYLKLEQFQVMLLVFLHLK